MGKSRAEKIYTPGYVIFLLVCVVALGVSWLVGHSGIAAVFGGIGLVGVVIRHFTV